MFDPSSTSLISWNWVAAPLILLLAPPSYWLVTTKYKQASYRTSLTLSKEFENLLSGSHTKKIGSSVGPTILFVSILARNYLGLIPYIFNTTSHISITLTLALPVWVALMAYGWTNRLKRMLAHLVPQRTPGPLIPFIVIIETTRRLIRPATLAVRLTANIIAGHLLMALLGGQCARASTSELPVLMVVQLLLSTLEISVRVIQAYVFSVLVTLYIAESIEN